jgi:RND superfamily putative drug exporter
VTAIARFAHRFPQWVIGAWILAAIVANLVAPQLEKVAAAYDQPLLPASSGSSVAVQRAGAAFSQTPTDNVAYLVLQRNRPLTDRDRALYQQLLTALRGDSRHVIEVVDWWGSPATAAAALSSDHHVATAMVRLSGMLGTLQASDSITAVRGIVAGLPAPEGLRTFIAGPGASIVDASAALDRQKLVVTITAVAALLVLLLIVYRSLISAMVPLVSVGLALAVARPIVAALGRDNLIGVSLFSVVFGSVVILGAGTGFAMFLIGRYHERRGQNGASAADLADAYRAAAPVIVGAALMLAAPMGYLTFARTSILRNIGSPCAIGVLTAALAVLTLTPALIAIADRGGLLKPRRQGMARRWWRIGTSLLRSPGPAVLGGVVLLIALASPLFGLQIGWDAATAAPAGAESSRAYQAVDDHFPPNQLLPDTVTIEADHDIRNPAGLIAVEQITGAIMTIPGVRMVQSASRLNGEAPQQVSFPTPIGPMGHIGEALDEASDKFAARQASLTDLDSAADEMLSSLDGIQHGLQAGSAGLGQVSSSARQMKGAVTKLRASVGVFGETIAPLTQAVAEVPDCQANRVCQVVREVTKWADLLVDTSGKMADGFGQLADGLAETGSGLQGLPLPGAFSNALGGYAGVVARAKEVAQGFKQLVNPLGTPIGQLPGFLRDLAVMFHGTPGVGLNVSLTALSDPATGYVLDSFISPNGHATRLFVYSDGRNWDGGGVQRARAITDAVLGATKEGSLKPTNVELTGIGPAIRDLRAELRTDLMALVTVTVVMIFGIVSLLLRSLVAGLAVVGTATASYFAAAGASVVIWQHLLDHDLHWSVLPISFFVLVAVCGGHHLYFALRAREELGAGPHFSTVRALAATGGVGISSGIVFATTMFALATCSALYVAEIGVTVGIGAILDTFFMRSFGLPATMALLGKWFWWPRRFVSDRSAQQRLNALAPPPAG